MNTLTCDLCGHVHDATRQLVDYDWQYRRSGILGVERNVIGAMPVVLTLQQLKTNMGAIRGNHLYSMSLILEPREKRTRLILSSIVCCLYHESIPKGRPCFWANARAPVRSTQRILRIFKQWRLLSRPSISRFFWLPRNSPLSPRRKSIC